jgi:simple sugar transport system permease protein
VLKIARGQNEMIISIMLNYVATLFMGVIYTSWLRDAERAADARDPGLLKLSRVVPDMRFTRRSSSPSPWA